METLFSVKIWLLLAGLGLFLFGMFLMEEAIKNLASRPFKLFLRKQTGSPIKAVLSGTITTAILQSSSLVTLLVMSFTSAGIIGLKNGIGVILGANLGTTLKGWLIALIGFKANLDSIIFPLLAIGGLGIIFLKRQILVNSSKFIMGFAFIFMGLDFIKDGFAELATQIDLSYIADKPNIFFLLVGIILTGLIQSSSASLVIFLSALTIGIIDLHQAIYLVIGSDLGTTATALIGTIKANSIKKKTGLAHLYFNIIQSTLAVLLIPVYLYMIQDLIGIKDDLIILVVIQSIFNLAAIIVVLPFLDFFTSLVERSIGSEQQTQNSFLNSIHPEEIISSIESLKKEAFVFAERSLIVIKQFLSIDEKTSPSRMIEYNLLKEYENEISSFYLKVQQYSKSNEEAAELNSLISIFRLMALSVKDIKDVKHNFEDLQNSVDDDNYNMSLLIKNTQKKFYEKVQTNLESLSDSGRNEMINLESLQREIHETYNTTPYIFKKFRGPSGEIDFSSAMNLIREINNSNESIINAYNQLQMLKGANHNKT